MSEKDPPEWAKRLRTEREQRHWSRSAMAMEMRRTAGRLRLGHLDQQRATEYVKRWERGLVGAPDAFHQIVLAGALGLSVEELFGNLATALPGVTTSRDAVEERRDLPYYAQAEEDSAQRRRFMAWLDSFAAGIAPIPDPVRKSIAVGGQPDILRRITVDDVDNLQATTDMFKAWDYRVGGGLSRHAVTAQLGWAVRQLDAHVPADSGHLIAEWKKTSALLAAVAGWKNHDAGFEQQARYLLALGYRLAAEADARGIQAYLLGAMVKQAVHIGHARVGLDLARHGLELADDGTPTVRCMLHALRARGHARLGDYQALARDLGLAEQEFGRITPDDRSREPWLHFYNEAELHGDSGTALRLFAWHHLSRSDPDRRHEVDQAGTRLVEAAVQYGDEFARSRALCNLMAASLYMKVSDPDAAMAIDVLSPASDLGSIHSVRVDNYSRDLQYAARPFRRRDDVQRMLTRLARTG